LTSGLAERDPPGAGEPEGEPRRSGSWSECLTAAVCAVSSVRNPDAAEADDWSDEQRLVILRHELGHLRRRDNWTNLLALLVCALHWFNRWFGRLRAVCDCAVRRHATTWF